MISDISTGRPPEKSGVPYTHDWPIELNRRAYAVWTVITTEAALFVCFFASYYFLGNNKDRWAIDTPPKMTLAFIMRGGFTLANAKKTVRACYAFGTDVDSLLAVRSCSAWSDGRG
jgi:heme/copper-type cytochrome/quinol oxidase subunit 3